MLLVVDVGNTHVACGVYRGRRLFKTWRVPTTKPPSRMAAGIMQGLPRGAVEGTCVCSVVPWADLVLSRALRKRLACDVFFATEESIGVPIVGYSRKEVGSDRLVNSLAAYRRYRRSLIIVDFGTATTFDVVTAKGEYVGGAIAPGIHLANRSLTDYTAKLPPADIRRTRRVIADTTVASMQAGVFHGYIGLVNHLIRAIRKEMRTRPKVIATGGLAPLIASSTELIEAVHPNLTLEGLRLVWELNAHS